MQVYDVFPSYFLNRCIQVRLSLRRKVQKWTQLHVTHSPALPNTQRTSFFLLLCSYSHDGKLQPCKFLFGRGKCEHGSSCRFSHDKPSPEALAVVQEQWKNGGIKIVKETIESCELTAFDSFMTTNRYHLSSCFCTRTLHSESLQARFYQ
jgi:hypothetical protein